MKVEAAPLAKAHIRYELADGTLVPGVTSVIGKVLAKPALIAWANRLGLEGYEIGKYVDHLAVIGKLGHAMVQHHLGGPAPDLRDYSPNQVDQAENVLIKYLDWEKGHSVRPILVETPLVSEDYGFGGTPDCYADVDDVPTVLDIKTGKVIYDDHFVQGSAYLILVRERRLEVAAIRILQLGRDETEGFSERVMPKEDAKSYAQEFLHALRIYQIRRDRGQVGRASRGKESVA